MDYDYIKKGDCLKLMDDIPDKSIDMILCDLPYGITNNLQVVHHIIKNHQKKLQAIIESITLYQQ